MTCAIEGTNTGTTPFTTPKRAVPADNLTGILDDDTAFADDGTADKPGAQGAAVP